MDDQTGGELRRIMETFESFLFYIGIFSTVLLIGKIVISLFHGHHGHEMQADHDQGGHFYLNLLTIQNFLSFFTMFSWVGLGCLKSDLGLIPTLLLASLSGIALILAMGVVMVGASKLTQDGTLKIVDVIGKTATVYLKIPSQRTGIGKINVVCGSLIELEALTDSKVDIMTGSTVKIVSVIGASMVLVEVV